MFREYVIRMDDKTEIKYNSELMGEIKIVNIKDPYDFMAIFDNILDEFLKQGFPEEGFFYNRAYLLECFTRGNFFGLEMIEDTTKQNRSSVDPRCGLFVGSSVVMPVVRTALLLPCFCVIEDGHISFLWTHPRIRKNGFAEMMITQSKCVGVVNVLRSSVDFWNCIKSKYPTFILKI